MADSSPTAELIETSVSELTEVSTAILRETAAPEARTVTALVKAQEGGIVELPGDTRIEIPPDALDSDTEITISIPDELNIELISPDDPTSLARDITLGSGSLKKPVKLIFSYHDVPVNEMLSPDAVIVAHWDGNQWSYLESSIDPVNKTVAVETDHFSRFGLFALPKIDEVFAKLSDLLLGCWKTYGDTEWSTLVTQISKSNIDATSLDTVYVYLDNNRETFSAMLNEKYIIGDRDFFERESKWLPAAKRHLLAGAFLAHELSHLVSGYPTDIEITSSALKESSETMSFSDFGKMAGINLRRLFSSMKARDCTATIRNFNETYDTVLIYLQREGKCTKFHNNELKADEMGTTWAGKQAGDINAVALVFAYWFEQKGNQSGCTHPSGTERSANIRETVAMGQDGGIFGTITASGTGESLLGVKITTDNGKGEETDKEGKFLITGLPAGNHNITYSKAGYQSVTRAINIISKHLVQVSLELELLPPETPTPVPTNTPDAVSSLRGTVTQQSSCRYGPSKDHLYKTGFKPDAPVKIIGRDADGDWLQVELGGGNTPCWMNKSLIQVEGDVMALPDMYPPDRRLPLSDAFPQITLISASPVGDGIAASWGPVEIRIDLRDTGTVEYLIEVWTCIDGKPGFYTVGTNDNVATFQIDNSCGIASYAHVIGQDEHGFSFPTKIPLP
jgi:hypothetical protein